MLDNGVAAGPFYNQLIAESSLVNYTFTGVYNVSETGHDRWGDPEMIREGVQFARNNFWTVTLTAAIGLLLVDTPRIRQVVLRSGVYHDRQQSLGKLLRAIPSIYSFLQDDLLDENSNGRKYITAVRNRHLEISGEQHRMKGFPRPPLPLTAHNARILAALQQDAASIPVSPKTRELFLDNTSGINQFDMSCAHYSFSCIIFVLPRQFGVDSSDTKGINAFMHLWAVIGSLMGVHDKFNCALHLKDTLSQRQILQDVMIPSFKFFNKRMFTIPETTVAVTLGRVLPILRLNAILYFFLNSVLEVEAPELERTLGPYDKAVVWVLSYFTKTMASWNSSVVGQMANNLEKTIGTKILLDFITNLIGETKLVDL